MIWILGYILKWKRWVPWGGNPNPNFVPPPSTYYIWVKKGRWRNISGPHCDFVLSQWWAPHLPGFCIWMKFTHMFSAILRGPAVIPIREHHGHKGATLRNLMIWYWFVKFWGEHPANSMDSDPKIWKSILGCPRKLVNGYRKGRWERWVFASFVFSCFSFFSISTFPYFQKVTENQKNNPVRRIWSKSIPDCFFWFFSRFFWSPKPQLSKKSRKPKKTKKTILWEESGVSLFQIVFLFFFGFSRGFLVSQTPIVQKVEENQKKQKNKKKTILWEESGVSLFQIVFFCFFWFFSRFLLSQTSIVQKVEENQKKQKNKKKQKKTILWEESGVSLFQIVFFVFFCFSRGFCFPKPFFFIPSCSHQPFNLQTKIWRWPGFLYLPFLPLRLLAVERLVEYFGIMFKWSFQNKMLSSTQKRCDSGFIEFKKKFFPPDPWIKHFCHIGAYILQTFCFCFL